MPAQQQLALTVTLRTTGGHEIVTRTTEEPEKLLRRIHGQGQRFVAIEGTDGMEHLVRGDAVESVSYDTLTAP
ncbi:MULTISPECIES: hypothetical protein [unclassified Dietzia]|uniref:hypothetical protein n=1 Tax=unclassified Dietzia TaxID=2617939 RepID=UPI0015FB2B54|nr:MULTISPECIES: hypothetical protein [unclassified Dietzia]MBB1022952.1 hypothetical protein [Dietzia sp. DQ12-76]MBB1026458.1 hypothetical protein [Dietzia sp. DQ11-38-2]